MTHIDIPADLNSEDESGLVWTFLDEAREPAVIRPVRSSLPAQSSPPRCARSWSWSRSRRARSCTSASFPAPLRSTASSWSASAAEVALVQP